MNRARPSRTEARARMAALLREACHPRPPGSRLGELGRSFTAMYDHLTAGRYSTMTARKAEAFESGDTEGLLSRHQEVLDELAAIRPDYPPVPRAMRFLDSWRDSAVHGCGYGDEDEWIPQGELYLQRLEA